MRHKTITLSLISIIFGEVLFFLLVINLPLYSDEKFVSQLKFWMGIIKIMNSGISFGLALEIYHLSRRLLNMLFTAALIGWGIYIGSDAVIYILAPNSESLFYLANFLRDVAIIGICAVGPAIIMAGFVIKEGEYTFLLERKWKFLVCIIIFVFIGLETLLNDGVVVMSGGQVLAPENLPPESPFSVNFDVSWLKHGINEGTWPAFMAFIFYLLIVASNFLGVFMISRVHRNAVGKARKRTAYIMAGIMMIPLGIFYFVILPLVDTYVVNLDEFVMNPIGQVIWALAPILVYLGIREK